MSVVLVISVVVGSAAREGTGIEGLGPLKLLRSDLGFLVLVRRLSLFEDGEELSSLGRIVSVWSAAQPENVLVSDHGIDSQVADLEWGAEWVLTVLTILPELLTIVMVCSSGILTVAF